MYYHYVASQETTKHIGAECQSYASVKYTFIGSDNGL